MRIAIFGAGGLGAYYGARLAEAGNEVGFIARGAHLAAIREQGLRILSPLGDVHLEAPLASDDPAAIGPVDLVVVAVKTWQIPQVAQALAPLLEAHTLVVPLLNGVEAPDGLARVVGAGRVLGGLSKVFSMIEAPGVVRHFHSEAYVEVGELTGGASERAQSVKELLEAAGVRAGVSADIRTALWRKLLMVSSWAGLGALARSPMGVMRAHSGTRTLIDRSMDEGIAVGAARGHDVTPAFKEELWAFYDSLPEGATASMQRDLMAGRPSELEAWNGAIVRFGAECGVPTPVHALTVDLLQPMEARARQRVSKTIEESRP